MANILLTGAFGNVGISILKELANRGHNIRCFDLATPATAKVAKQYAGGAEILWGDLRKPADLAAAVRGQDVVLHVAAVIPPLSEREPDLALAVNVNGTLSLLAAMLAEPRPPRLVFASSISVLGRNRDRTHLARPHEPHDPSDGYSRHKAACEIAIRESGLDWCILRLNAVMPLKLDQVDPIMFELDMNGQVEFVHTRDAGLAFANAAEATNVSGRLLHIGGGRSCQYTYREFFTKFLAALGIGMLPETAFGPHKFYTDWMDTSESQALLHYQRYSYDQYLSEIVGLLGWRRPLIKLFRPLVRRWMLMLSPYYADAQQEEKAAIAVRKIKVAAGTRRKP